MKEQLMEMMSLLKNLSDNIKELRKKQHTSSKEMKIIQEEIRNPRTEQKEFKKEVKQLKDISEKALKEMEVLKEEVKVSNGRIGKLEEEKSRKN
jgi:DNA topoisomerase VI subunit A